MMEEYKQYRIVVVLIGPLVDPGSRAPQEPVFRLAVSIVTPIVVVLFVVREVR